MEKITWNIRKNEDVVEKYCPGCKRKVDFKDSKVRRHNANGKNIFKFAIYKCDKGHTWNKILDKYHSEKYNEISEVNSRVEHRYNSKEIIDSNLNSILDFSQKSTNFEIHINMDENTCTRIDKSIFDNSENISRSKIQELIKNGYIKVNGKNVKQNYKLKHSDKIIIVNKNSF